MWLAALLIAGCSTPDTHYRIGLSQCSDDAWRTKMNEEMRREMLFYPEMELRIRSAASDSRQQSLDIDSFIAERVDLLIVSPNEADGLTDAVSRAYDAGIPVIIADRRVHGDKYTAFIGGDNVQVGRLLADYITDARCERVIELLGLEGSTPAVLRHKGMTERLAERGNTIRLIEGRGNWLREIARDEMIRLLARYPDVQMVVAQNDQMAIGAWEAAEELLPGNTIRFIGVDALSGEGNGLEAILQGKIEASVSYATEGGLLIQRAAQILNNEPFTRDTVLSAMLIDRDAAAPLNQLYCQESHEVQTISLLQQHINLYTAEYRQQRTVLWLIIVLAVTISLFLFYYLRLYRRHKRLADELMQAQQHIEEATRSKLTFFTNVSHDFRTPLTLIADPLHQLTNEPALGEQQHALAQMAYRNTRVLLRLINQVLDFRKYESGMMHAKPSPVDMQQAMQEWTEAFQPLARQRQIHLSYEVVQNKEENFVCMLDAEKTERMVFNLIANAFKFTPDGGRVSVRLWRENNCLLFSVTDNGIGIPEAHKKRVFDTFFQLDTTTNAQGSGIGLALVRSFAQLQGGSVSVADNPEGKGTVFTVSLPMENQPVSNDRLPATNYATITSDLIMTELYSNGEEHNDTGESKGEENPLPILLAIDDNADIRAYLRQLFERDYTVLTAANGTTGLQVAVQSVPNVVICDLSMPDMDGLEVCRQLKMNPVTSHIPVLMLTARTLDEQQIEGYTHGADAYVAKPFSADVLRAQIASILENRRRVQMAAIGERVEAKVEDNKPDPEDLFVIRFTQLVQERIDDETLNVEDIASQMAMSRTQLYRKLKALTNNSPNELIKEIRMREAKQLLAQGNLSVSEVAYRTGFTSPSYFTKCYTEYFGTLPSKKAKGEK